MESSALAMQYSRLSEIDLAKALTVPSGPALEAEMRLDAQFLFDNDSCKYLKEVRDRVATLSKAETSMEHEASPSDTKTEWKRIRKRNLDWIRQQGDGQTDFTKWFTPFLKYEPVKRPWFLRLPS